MSHNLSTMIEEINAASSKLKPNQQDKESNGGEESLAQIVRILNGHLSALQSIDAGAEELKGKVEAARKEGRSVGEGVRGSGWLDGFGRSYLGRS